MTAICRPSNGSRSFFQSKRNLYFNSISLFIDNVSVIQTVIAIGLCVDYAAHVGHCFMLKAGTREERVVAVLKDVGAAVLNGGVSTFLAVVLLAGSSSYVFRVLFKQFFLTVVLGLAHGMIFLPVLSSILVHFLMQQWIVLRRRKVKGKFLS